VKNTNILLLKDAYKSFSKNRYSEAIVLLEKITANRPQKPYPYFLLCVSYLLCDKFSSAEIMLKKLRSIDPEYLPLNHLDAFLLLKSASGIHSALSVYIDKLDRFPDDTYFKKVINKLQNVKNFSSFQKNAKLKYFVQIPKPKMTAADFSQTFYEKPVIKKLKKSPEIHKHGHGRIIFYLTALFILLISAGIFIYFYYFKTGQVAFKNTNTTQIDSISIDILQYDLIDKILTAKPPVFYYSNDEVISDFNKAKYLIKNEKYNDALLLVNKISSSNANFRVKERNDFLRKFIADVEHKDYSGIPVEKVFQKPYLYRGYFVSWKGKITNLRKKESSISFNLLVDYKKDDKFSEVIDVYSEKEYENIKNGDIAVINGVFVNSIGNSNRLYLVADMIQKNDL
jgi:hypothetical protein